MEYFNKQSKLFLITLGLLLVLFIGVLNFLTGTEISRVTFYLLPISLVTWFVGRWTGILLSGASAITWFIADSTGGAIYQHYLIPYWNATMIFGFFSIFSYVLSTLKNTVEREKKAARIDALTGVANGRFFYELANIELSRASRYKHPFTVAYMDVDNFKFVNDRFGHSTGDSLLRLVAETIRNNIRESDTIARLGGDEFAILMPETGYESAQMVISRVQKSLLDVKQKNGWPVTFSIGVATFIRPPNSVDETVKKSDELMFAVKNKGKNSTRHKIFPERWETEEVQNTKSKNSDS
jgi:diguanylate cyclase (GGDEF)-like protein